MPVGEYFAGHGTKVMAAMRRLYGKERAERIFYATANKDQKKVVAQAAHIVRKSRKKR